MPPDPPSLEDSPSMIPPGREASSILAFELHSELRKKRKKSTDRELRYE